MFVNSVVGVRENNVMLELQSRHEENVAYTYKRGLCEIGI